MPLGGICGSIFFIYCLKTSQRYTIISVYDRGEIKMWQCRILTRAEITDTYNVHMKNDFPKDELKPFSMILRSLDKRQYICYGIFSGDILCGYAYFAIIVDNNKEYYLLDYFATVREMRGKGIGSAFLNMLNEHMTDVEMVICETENPKELLVMNLTSETGVSDSILGISILIQV